MTATKWKKRDTLSRAIADAVEAGVLLVRDARTVMRGEWTFKILWDGIEAAPTLPPPRSNVRQTDIRPRPQCPKNGQSMPENRARECPTNGFLSNEEPSVESPPTSSMVAVAAPSPGESEPTHDASESRRVLADAGFDNAQTIDRLARAHAPEEIRLAFADLRKRNPRAGAGLLARELEAGRGRALIAQRRGAEQAARERKALDLLAKQGADAALDRELAAERDALDWAEAHPDDSARLFRAWCDALPPSIQPRTDAERDAKRRGRMFRSYLGALLADPDALARALDAAPPSEFAGPIISPENACHEA